MSLLTLGVDSLHDFYHVFAGIRMPGMQRKHPRPIVVVTGRQFVSDGIAVRTDPLTHVGEGVGGLVITAFENTARKCLALVAIFLVS